MLLPFLRTVVVPEGSGKALGDIDNVAEAIDALKAVDPTLKRLHSLFFGQIGTKHVVKKNLRKFCGIAEADAEGWSAKTKVPALTCVFMT